MESSTYNPILPAEQAIVKKAQQGVSEKKDEQAIAKREEN
jgi:hypothetical protein